MARSPTAKYQVFVANGKLNLLVMEEILHDCYEVALLPPHALLP